MAKALLEVEYIEEKQRSIEALSKVVASLRRVLEEEEMVGKMVPAARKDSSAASRDSTNHGATMLQPARARTPTPRQRVVPERFPGSSPITPWLTIATGLTSS